MSNNQDNSVEDLKSFTLSFFKSIGSKIESKQESLEISQIPKDFEDSYGKPGPYIVVFDKEARGELVSRGSFLLKLMTSYLEKRGQTALVRLVFDHDYLEAFKRSFSFKKCELSALNKTTSYEPIYLFSFSTNLQYLNEKEQITNVIATKEGRIINFSLEQYKYEQGDSKDSDTASVKENYSIAKNSLKNLIEPRVKDLTEVLSNKISIESSRIKEHYDKQLKEREENVLKIREQIASIEKISNINSTMSQRKERLLETLKTLEDPQFEKKIIEERDFFIRDEEYKHALSISNKLVSTTIVCCPIITFTLTLRGRDSTRMVKMTYDPLKNDFKSKLECEQCKREIREIFLCGSSHLICGNCFDVCRSCEGGLCSLCIKKTCSQCARKLCKRCATRCPICWKDCCKSHMHKNYASETEGCPSCLKQCSRCGSFADKTHRKIDLDGTEICLKCAKLAAISF